MCKRGKNLLITTLACLGLGLSVFNAGASNWYRRFDNTIKRILLDGVDTSYVGLPATSWEIPSAFTMYGESLKLASSDGSVLPMDSGIVSEVGIGIGYHGLDYVQYFSTSKNVFSDHFEFNFYDNSWGFQIITSDNKYTTQDLGIKEVTFGGYIALNGRQYSYPAVYYGNYIQKKSAGSPLIYFWYEHTKSYAIDPAPDLSEEYPNIINLAVCGGYGYNWAFNKGKTLLNASASVGIIAPYWGVATQARLSAMHWFNDNLRLSFSAINYFSTGQRQLVEPYFLDEWMTVLSLSYCFGK